MHYRTESDSSNGCDRTEKYESIDLDEVTDEMSRMAMRRSAPYGLSLKNASDSSKGMAA